MDTDVSYAKVDSYTVVKQQKGITLITVFKDPQGNIFLTVKWESFGNKMALEDNAGKQVGLVTRKIISLNPTYELFDSDNKPIGRVVVRPNFGFSMGEDLLLQDPTGNTLVIAHGSLLNLNFALNSADGTKCIASVSSNAGKETGLLKNIKDFVMKSYNVEILDKTINDVSRLFILEFLVVIENMISNNRTMGGVGMSGATFRI